MSDISERDTLGQIACHVCCSWYPIFRAVSRKKLIRGIVGARDAEALQASSFKLQASSFKKWNISFDSSPEDGEVNEKIPVNEAISHASHKTPRDLWMLLAIVIRYLVGSFAENLKNGV